MFAVTFAGGLGSIIAAACILAGAVGVDRAVAGNFNGHIPWGEEGLLTAAIVLLGVGLVYVMRWAELPKEFRWAVYAVFGFFATAILLIWIGLAAGIK